MGYKIKITYSTGDSFHTEDTFDYLDFSWEKMGVVKENLKRIEDHYKMNNSGDDYSGKDADKYKTKDWFVYVPKPVHKTTGVSITEKEMSKLAKEDWEYLPDPFFAEHSINLKADNEMNIQINAFWIGYFERLISIKAEFDDMEITF